MSSPMNDRRMHGQDLPTAQDVSGGLLVLLAFLVPTLLAAAYLSHATRMLSELVREAANSALLRGAR